MDSDHVLVLFLALVLVGVAVALAYASPLVFGGDGDGVTDASLERFETTEAYCGDPDAISTSSGTHDVRGGEALVINQTVPVSSNDTVVNGSLESFGPERFVLEVTRHPPEGDETPTPEPADGKRETPIDDGTTETPDGDAENGDEQCHPEVRYNATIHVVDANAYTVLVTYDDELVNVFWQEGEDSGSYERFPDTPVETDGNETATNERVRPSAAPGA